MSAVSYFRMRVFSFSVSYAYFFLCCLVFVLPSFIHAESMREFDLLAPAIIILSCCILMSELCLAYVFVVVFSKTHRFFVLNQCVLWLQSRSCYTANFCYLTLLSVYWNQGLISLKFSHPGLVYTEFCGSRAEVVLRQFFLSDSVKRVLEPGA